MYQEILQYSYQDYFAKFVIPYYQARGVAAGGGVGKRRRFADLQAGLRANPGIRVIVNQNDFLLSDEDLAWLRATVAPEQLTVFPQGGHLGNLDNPLVQKAIVGALAGLQPARPRYPVKND